MKTISDYGRQLWVIGSPIEHTLSPPIHNAAFKAADLPHRYFALEVQNDELGNFLTVFKELEGLGANITLPLKESIQEFVQRKSRSVIRTGAANTLYWSDGELALENTDVYGFKQLVKPWEDRITSGSVLLLGAGGAARACLLALEELDVGRVLIWNRTTEKARSLSDQFSEMNITVLSDEQLHEGSAEAELVVNSTSLGLEDGDSSPYPAEQINDGMVGVDLIYGRTTRFQRDFDQRGDGSVGGMTMLIQQAARAWELWTGQAPDVSVMESVVREEKS